MRLVLGNCTVNATKDDMRAALARFRIRTHSLHASRQQQGVGLSHELTDCTSTDTPVSRLHADLAMETADPLMMAAAVCKYQEDCMILAAQKVCNGRSMCGLETWPAQFHHLTFNEFQVPPSICANLRSPRKKRFLGMLLGLFNLAHAKRYTDPTLKMLKKNVNTLRENQDQIHGDLAKLYRMVNLSKTELGEHRRLLHKLDENAVTMRIRMDRVFDALGELQRQAIGQYLLTSAQIKLGTLQDGIHQYEHVVTTLYDYLLAISTQTVTPAVLTPHQLCIVLRRVKEHIVNQLKLTLPGDPDTDVWSYYGYIRTIPAIVGQTLLVSLQIPLANISTTLRFYRVHSFPLLDPHTQQQFSYELESPYLAVDAKTDYYTLPAEAEVSLCVATRSKWCRLAQPMYTVDTSRHCVLALFLKQNALITKFCTIIRHHSTGVYAAQLQPRIWVVSLARSMLLWTECMTTGRDRCVLEPPYSLVSLPQTCYAHIRDSLFLPSSMELSLTVNKTLISTYPHLAFHAQYHPMSAFRLFKGLNKTVDPEEVKALTTQLLEYDKLPMPQMTEKLRQLDYNYPKPFGITEFFKSKYFIIGMVVAVVLLLLVGVGLACWKFQAFRMFCFSFCQRKRESQKSFPVPQPRPSCPASAAEEGMLRKVL